MFEVRILFPWRLKNPTPEDKIFTEVIDEAEGTPGFSRQVTRFKSECQPGIDEILNRPESHSMSKKQMTEMLNEHSMKYGFRLDRFYTQTSARRSKTGESKILFDFRLVFDSVEDEK